MAWDPFKPNDNGFGDVFSSSSTFDVFSPNDGNSNTFDVFAPNDGNSLSNAYAPVDLGPNNAYSTGDAYSSGGTYTSLNSPFRSKEWNAFNRQTPSQWGDHARVNFGDPDETRLPGRSSVFRSSIWDKPERTIHTPEPWFKKK